MKFRILMPLLTYPDATPLTGIPLALDFAAKLNADMTVIIHEVDIPLITEPLANLVMDVQAMSDAAEALSRSRVVELARAVRQHAEGSSLPLTIETFRAPRLSGELIATRGRSYDLTILPCLPDGPDHALVEEEVLFGSGGPVVILPAEAKSLNLKRVAVAWDGSRAASRALRDALGVLTGGEQVIVLTADADKSIAPDSLASALSFIEGHEMAVTHRSIPRANGAIGDILQQAAIDEGAGLLVMGAYGHSRMREFVLGGATRSVLRNPRLPILMSH
jgi:nucleotide-binding universal stress UspA family protein